MKFIKIFSLLMFAVGTSVMVSSAASAQTTSQQATQTKQTTTLTYDATGCVFSHSTTAKPSAGHLGAMGFNGLSMTNGNAYFKVNGTSSIALSISGTNNTFRLYNPLTGRYNAIWAADAYIPDISGQFKPLTESRVLFGDPSDVTGISTYILPTSVPEASKGYDFELSTEDLAELYPTTVLTTSDGKTAVDYNALLPLIVASIQKAGERVGQQKQQILLLTEELNELNNQEEE